MRRLRRAACVFPCAQRREHKGQQVERKAEVKKGSRGVFALVEPKTPISHIKRLMAVAFAGVALVAVSAGLASVSVPAYADAANKTLTVDMSAEEQVGETYQTVQQAINYIDTQEGKVGWTITVKEGAYPRFTVLNDLDDLTVCAADGAKVTVDVSNNSEALAPTSDAYPDTAGVSIRQASGVILQGLTFNVGTQSSPWTSAAVSNYSESGLKGNNFKVINCAFDGEGSNRGVFVNTGTTQFTVEGCTFSGLKEAISMYGDGTLMASASVQRNSFDDCSFALHGYYGGTGDAGKLTFANNTVTGSDDRRCKIVIQDQTNTGALKVDVCDNALTNAVVGLLNLREPGETVSDVLASNDFGAGSFYVEAVEPGTIDFYTSYQVPEGSVGGWALTGIDDFDVDWGKNPDGSTAIIADLVTAANAAGSNILNVTGIDADNLIKTFTWFKDGMYWVSYPQAGSLTVSKTVEGQAADPDQEFTFKVVLNNASVNGEFGDMTFSNGVTEVVLKAGESVTADGLPAKALVNGAKGMDMEPVTYAVIEQEAEGFTTHVPDNAEGTLVEGESVEVSFVNVANESVAPATPTDPSDFATEQVKAPVAGTRLAQTGDPLAVVLPVAVLAAAVCAGVCVFALRRARR